MRRQVVLETGNQVLEKANKTAKDRTMNLINYTFKSEPFDVTTKDVICGVVGSGNLEILVSELDDSEQSKFIINTSVSGFDHIWEAVIQEFVNRYAVGGLQFEINDMGATPAVVSLRLSQAINILEGEAHE